MKVILLFGAIIAAGNALPKFPEYKESDRFFLMPDDNGIVHLVDALLTSDEPIIETRTSSAAFWLYTRNNRNSPQIVSNAETVANSFFSTSRETKFIIHGWKGNGNSGVNAYVKDAFLNQGDYNVIVVDWSSDAGGLYLSARNRVPNVARSVSDFILILRNRGVSLDRIHLVGFSLGGHIVGQAGRNLSGGVARITGLDPAGPLWGSSSGRIHRNDGRYVEIIHTNAGVAGQWDDVGDVDFYPNGGASQPGCGFLGVSCSHSRSYKFFAEAISSNRFVGRGCSSASEATSNRCTGSGTSVMGGVNLSKSGNGIFHLTTNSDSPFAQG